MSNMYEGQIVEIKKDGIINHPGIVVWDDFNWAVIHNTPKTGTVIKQSLQDFMAGEKLRFPQRYKKYLPDTVIAQRAKASVGKEWTLTKYNCQHFVTHMCGAKPRSFDLQLALLVLLFTTTVLMLTKRA